MVEWLMGGYASENAQRITGIRGHRVVAGGGGSGGGQPGEGLQESARFRAPLGVLVLAERQHHP